MHEDERLQGFHAAAALVCAVVNNLTVCKINYFSKFQAFVDFSHRHIFMIYRMGHKYLDENAFKSQIFLLIDLWLTLRVRYVYLLYICVISACESNVVIDKLLMKNRSHVLYT
jgi:hypothetical protein